MLLSFRVQNYRSIREEQELSLMRSRRMAAHRPETTLSKAQVSPVAGIYGSNASGKSNLLLALTEMRSAVVWSHSRWAPDGAIPYDPFLLNTESASVPTRFEVEFLLNEVRYQYGFELNAEEILKEWLYAHPHGRRQTWFERDTTRSETWYFGKALGGRNKVTADVTRRNSLYLSAAATLKHPRLIKIFRWFDHNLLFENSADLPSRLSFTISQIESDEELKGQITTLLKFADLGICGLKIERLEFSQGERDHLLRIVQTVMENSSEGPPSEVVEKAIQEIGTTIQLQHLCDDVAEPVSLSFNSESLGTQAFLALGGPVLQALRSGSTLMVDEIDTSLHPRLVAEIIRLFQNSETNPKNAQIIFSSHDTSLLGSLIGDEPILERDQVWFVEKDRKGASSIYALTDFTPRRLENLERGYLQGRYGAVPFLDQKEFLPALGLSELDR